MPAYADVRFCIGNALTVMPGALGGWLIEIESGPDAARPGQSRAISATMSGESGGRGSGMPIIGVPGTRWRTVRCAMYVTEIMIPPGGWYSSEQDADGTA